MCILRSSNAPANFPSYVLLSFSVSVYAFACLGFGLCIYASKRAHTRGKQRVLVWLPFASAKDGA